MSENHTNNDPTSGQIGSWPERRRAKRAEAKSRQYEKSGFTAPGGYRPRRHRGKNYLGKMGAKDRARLEEAT